MDNDIIQLNVLTYVTVNINVFKLSHIPTISSKLMLNTYISQASNFLIIIIIRDVKHISNFRASFLKFKFELQTFGTQSSD